ncbi:MAG: hypothetical protein Q7S74_06565 [Nanoarchaeota archaeon]|nr:hypothetical protein [Nanoarchaeota archaeon]
MDKPIGIRLPKDILKKIEILAKNRAEDRSTVIRKLVLVGYSQLIKQKSAGDYVKGVITLSEAANRCSCTFWEMEKYLVEQGYKSDYSIEDLESELKSFRK